jgi:EAL domain-containing protein (putative c-di-GMP-specific phosphodiesterase class I)
MTLASCVNSNQENLFSKVSMALKYAKDHRLPFWIYEDRMRFENEYERNLSISNVVRHAVENSKIIPYFQPIIDNNTLKINKYECLARLLDEDDNIISPSLFIPISKRIKVYNLVTKTIIDKSFEVFEKNDYEFCINISMEDMINSEMFNFILNKLKYSNASNRAVFEIVESEAIQDFEKIERFINEIKRYGAKIAIDDFGDGYSNFSYLIKMNVDFLKIDGSLIKDIDTDKNSYLVVETIVDFAKKLGVKTIAEFVHSSTVMDKVKSMGIDFSQGYHIDKPSLNIE